jgi:hypothetical protein
MRKYMKRIVDSVTLVMLAGLISGASRPDDQSYTKTDDALKLVQLTKTTSVTYAAYGWNVITLPGSEPVEEWSAEFHSGSLHRVETPRDRVIADCKEMTGTYLSLTTGNVTSGPGVAKSACGINTAKEILSAVSIGKVKGRFGYANRIRITDKNNIRTYDISDDGIIVGCVYTLNDKSKKAVIKLEVRQIDRNINDSSIFSIASLSSSAVPEKFRVAP